MKLVFSASVIALLASSTNAFTASCFSQTSSTSFQTSLNVASVDLDMDLATESQGYVAGGADTEFARRFGKRSGERIKTVGEAMSDFTDLLERPINALYKNTMTDLVGTTHLITVNARFQRDPIWSLGLLSSMDLILENYPEKDMAQDIKRAFILAVGGDGVQDESTLVAEAQQVIDWAAQGSKTQADVTAALRGDSDENSVLGTIGANARGDEYWMYSRFFGLGLVKLMEMVGVETTAEANFAVMQEWMNDAMGKPYFAACSDSDFYYRSKSKLDMMATLMKEINIREKKKQADRLEAKAEIALAQAAREEEFAKEEEKEKTESSKE